MRLSPSYTIDQLVQGLGAVADELFVQPLSAQACNDLGELYFHVSKMRDARRYFEKALCAEPADARARNNLGVLAMLAGDLETAKRLFLEVLEDDPNDFNARDNLASLRDTHGAWFAENNPIARRLQSAIQDPVRLEELLALPASTHDYCIFITPRSGSTWLTSLLEQTGVAGVPKEWLNADGDLATALQSMPCRTVNDYISVLRRRHCSDNGVFGVEIDYGRLMLLEELGAPLDGLLGRNTRYLYLKREDLVAQAVSLYLAVESGYWHSSQKEAEIRRQAVEHVPYDEDRIAHWFGHLVNHEYGLEKYFRVRGIQPLRLVYEHMCCDPQATVTFILHFLGMAGPPAAPKVPSLTVQPVGTDRNREWIERFSAARKDMVRYWQRRRGMDRYIK